ncbi:hypothetical protein Barb7_00285 [Bacteroidales bacterium Barb7]|nr:hypothetical protein Barb7_00285 [Bacteroidales bacterium Barb7]
MDSYDEAKAKRNEAFKKDLDALLKKWNVCIDVDLSEFYCGGASAVHMYFEVNSRPRRL